MSLELPIKVYDELVAERTRTGATLPATLTHLDGPADPTAPLVAAAGAAQPGSGTDALRR